MLPLRPFLPLVLLAAMGWVVAAGSTRESGENHGPSSVGRAPADAGSDDGFLGHDRFDDVRTLDQLRDLECEIEAVVRRVRPSVVLLRAEGGRRGTTMGSAVIISKDGLLATCGHVGGRPGRTVTAELADGTELAGVTLGQAFEHGVDCGLVQLDTEGVDLPIVALGTSGDLATGDWVIAMGYTHGLARGARPALVRVGRVLRNEAKALLIDAPIDAGDSGGPAFNLRGEVVGLNSRCGRESWQNVATPIDLLGERFETLASQRVAVDEPPDDRAPRDRRRHRGPATAFDGADFDGAKLAVERAVPLDAVSARAEESMVVVYSGDRRVAYGVVTAARGLALTKASQLEPNATIEVETAGGQRHAAAEVARDPALDLALLRFAPCPDERLAPITWDSAASMTPGQVLLTPRDAGRRPALGFAAIERRGSEVDAIDAPFLGVETRPSGTEELERAAVEQAVTVVRVLPNTAAELAGLRPSDIVLEVDGEAIGSPVELRRTLISRQAGDRVEFKVVSGAGTAVVAIALGRRGDSDTDMRRGNTATPISRRSSGFGSLVAHDTVTDPTEMGGPLVDLDGRVVGMNIARYDRTATHAIDARVMARASRELLHRSRDAMRTTERGEPARRR